MRDSSGLAHSSGKHRYKWSLEVHGDPEKAKAQALTLSYWDSRIEGPHYFMYGR